MEWNIVISNMGYSRITEFSNNPERRKIIIMLVRLLIYICRGRGGGAWGGGSIPQSLKKMLVFCVHGQAKIAVVLEQF